MTIQQLDHVLRRTPTQALSINQINGNKISVDQLHKRTKKHKKKTHKKSKRETNA